MQPNINYTPQDCRWCDGSGKDREKDIYCRVCSGVGSVLVAEPLRLCVSCEGTCLKPSTSTFCPACRGRGYAHWVSGKLD